MWPLAYLGGGGFREDIYLWLYGAITETPSWIISMYHHIVSLIGQCYLILMQGQRCPSIPPPCLASLPWPWRGDPSRLSNILRSSLTKRLSKRRISNASGWFEVLELWLLGYYCLFCAVPERAGLALMEIATGDILGKTEAVFKEMDGPQPGWDPRHNGWYGKTPKVGPHLCDPCVPLVSLIYWLWELLIFPAPFVLHQENMAFHSGTMTSTTGIWHSCSDWIATLKSTPCWFMKFQIWLAMHVEERNRLPLGCKRYLLTSFRSQSGLYLSEVSRTIINNCPVHLTGKFAGSKIERICPWTFRHYLARKGRVAERYGQNQGNHDQALTPCWEVYFNSNGQFYLASSRRFCYYLCPAISPRMISSDHNN